MATCYISVGSNLGNRIQNIDSAIERLKKTKGCSVETISPVYETKAQGGPPQGKYLNAAIKIKTDLSASDLLNSFKKIESDMGRPPSDIKWAPRAIDLDILLYGDAVIEDENLIVPHPLMHKRWFVLKPLSDIAKDVVHSVFKKTVNELLKELEAQDAG